MIKLFWFSEHAVKLLCAMRFVCLKNIHVDAFFFVIKYLYARKGLTKLENITSLANFCSLYQLFHLQVYCNGFKP